MNKPIFRQTRFSSNNLTKNISKHAVMRNFAAMRLSRFAIVATRRYLRVRRLILFLSPTRDLKVTASDSDDRDSARRESLFPSASLETAKDTMRKESQDAMGFVAPFAGLCPASHPP